MSVLAVGTVAFDHIETPFGQRERALGGSASYITLAARYLCPEVRLVAVVGKDFPQEYIDILVNNGVDIRGLEVDMDGLTFAWGGRYHFDLNNRDTIYTDLNVLADFNPQLPEDYRSSRILCLGNLDPGTQISVLEQADKPDLVLADTMNYWIEHTPDMLRRLLTLVDCLVVNDSEARELSEEPNLIRAARKIRSMGPDILVIKKGEHGALLFTEDATFSVPAYPLEDIQDPTGAGDAFMGGFAGFLATADNVDLDVLKQALVFGSAIASFSVERFGPERLVNLTRAEINSRIAAFRNLTAIPS